MSWSVTQIYKGMKYHTCYNMDEPLKHYSSGKSQMQAITYCMIFYLYEISVIDKPIETE